MKFTECARLSLVALLVWIQTGASKALQLPSAFNGNEPQDAAATRRSFLNKGIVATATFGAGLMNKASSSLAEDTSSILPSSTSLYNVQPDASPNLDPKLERMDNLNFVRSLSSNSGSIWLGEHHNSEKDHAFQNQFIRSIYQERRRSRNQAPVAIGLEQVQAQFQPVLDAYIAKRINIKELRAQVEWDRRWTWSFEGYQPIFETAREFGMPLLALNVNSEDLSLVEKKGYPGLPRERMSMYITDRQGFASFAQSRQFSTYVNYVIAPSYDIHEKLGLLQYTMTGEKMDEPLSFRNFLSGRILWDEAMASRAHTWVSDNPNGLLIGLVGADHVKFLNGIPARYSRIAKNKAIDVTSNNAGVQDSVAVIINPTLIDSRPSGSVVNVDGSDSSQTPDRITLQLRYLKDGVDASSEARRLPESTGGVMPFANYIVVT
uniref:Haem-binding uptake Tiki superfamily ChaN domain-containing protein n=1 Tax=Craspedostauros australis TaxID=1486917 RepID=A0A7S0F650_9STRA|mmetsp:Transcript_7844/g.21168  ORF Transcript_7844/g.21168 Transcript_7844/m.21168 type:complete len:434 (+) Transcript_7844:181-1482(+)|eukprot:CAMPEP_0198132540 /NCGR_PEP_ID=MMETSP1442-20131203/58522_1 /TAXON_ID= /ORGANISM="Craspedostauros australis, Strain CCMP3328" /LENGTH=433 /DNA_ID=CAMNT_0043793563 /DNA_START=114 /DNA_END=1415 /DNA_ORIENTATION=+